MNTPIPLCKDLTGMLQFNTLLFEKYLVIGIDLAA
jgi:hypothetical protein